MSLKLDTFKNAKNKTKTVVTTVAIRQDQKDFLEKNKVNISELVRALLDELIERESKNKK